MNRQRKTVLLLILSLCLLTACGREPEEPAGTAWTPVQMARAVWDSQPPLEGYALTCDGGDFAPYLRDTLGIDPADVADGAVLYAGASAPRRSWSCAWRRRKTCGTPSKP